MAYQALYRKYRPFDFEDVIGQKNIVKTLKNSLNLNKYSHAYLFSGPRGTGKTTLAKIFAKNINCLNPQNGLCCGKCENCLSILKNECSDIIEIDAASNNGVEEIREIRNNINLVPSQLKYKVYIIDEVHMLSIGAFNALLKTLEEPPSHVIFILATTDLHKVPITIVSRCQCFEFKKINDNDIVERLKYVVEKENIDIDEDVLYKIAKVSDGGMRDSLSLLDKIRSYNNEKITLEDFYEINGSIKEEIINDFINYIINKDIINILKTSDYINESGKDYIVFSQDILDIIRNKIVNFYIRKKENEDINFLINFANKFNKVINDLKNSSNIKIMFETSILSLINIQNVNKNVLVEQKIEESTNKVSENKAVEIKNENDSNVKTEFIQEKTAKIKEKNIENDIVKEYLKIRKTIVNNAFVTANKDYLLNMKNNWYLINDYILDNNYSKVVSYLKDVELRVVGEHEIIISCMYDSILETGIKLLEKLEKLLELIYNNKYKVALVTNEEWDKERIKYISDRKKGINYEYIPLEEKNKKDGQAILSQDINTSSLTHDLINMFGEDIVKIQ